METINSKKNKLSFMDCYRFMKELRLYLFTDKKLVENFSYHDSGILNKINQKLEDIETEIMNKGLNINQDWDIRIRDIKLGCEVAMRIETKNQFNPDKIEHQKKLEGEGKTIMDLNRPEIRFMWEAFKIGEKFSNVEDLDIHLLYNELDGVFYKLISKINKIILKSTNNSILKIVFIQLLYDVTECIVKNNLDGYAEINIDRYIDIYENNFNFGKEFYDINCDVHENGLIKFVKLSRKLHRRMLRDANI